MTYKPETEFDPEKYVRIPSVAVFKEHERVKGGRSIKVTRKDLQQIADNHNQKFRLLGVGVPLSYGHTLDGEVKEEEQPELVGWCVSFKVDKLPTGEDALFGDFYLPKDRADWILDNLPTRSVEYFPNSQRLHPIALLKTSAPELDLPIIRYSGEDAPYRYTLSDPIPHSESEMPNDKKDEKEMKSDCKTEKYEDDDKAMAEAEKDATQGAVKQKSDTADLSAKMDQVMAFISKFAPLLEQLEGLMGEEEEGADPMQPAGGEPDGDEPEMEKEMPKEKGDKKPKEKDSAKKVEGDPVKFEGAMPSATNTSVPSYNKDKKEEYKMNDETVKYKQKVETLEAELLRYKKEQAAKDAALNELVKDKKMAVAKELVRKLEDEEMVAYKSDKERREDIAFFNLLDADEQRNYFNMAKDRYAKKTPVASEAAKYQSQEAALSFDPADAMKIADEAVKKGISFAEALKARSK